MSATTKRSSMQRALRARDAGLRKVSIVTRVAVAGAVVASGLFSALAAWAQPGRTKVVGSPGQGQAAPAPSPNQDFSRGPADRSGDDENLSPPVTPPAPDDQYGGPVVVSGAS